MRDEWPIPLRTWRISTCPVVSTALGVYSGPRPGCHTNRLGMRRLLGPGPRAVSNARRLDPALARDVLDRRQLMQSVQCRQHHVVRVRRPQTLGQDVGDPRALHDRAHRAASDDTGTWGRRLHQHAAGAMLADHLVRNRAARQRNGGHAPPRGVDGLADRFRHLVRLARRESHFALAIAHRHQRVEREPAATLHDFRDTVDRDDVLQELATLTAPVATPIATARPPVTIPAATTRAATTTAAATRPAASATAARPATPAATRAATPTAPAARPAAATARPRTARTGRARRRRCAGCGSFILCHRTRYSVRTRGRPHGRHPPPPSPGRGTCTLRDRTRPGKSPRLSRAPRSSVRPPPTSPSSSPRLPPGSSRSSASAAPRHPLAAR